MTRTERRMLRELEQKRAKARAEFIEQSVGAQWMIRVALEQHAASARITQRLNQQRRGNR